MRWFGVHDRGDYVRRQHSVSDFSTRTLVLLISSLAAIALQRSCSDARYVSVWNRR
jgi:hypothetical protein